MTPTSILCTNNCIVEALPLLALMIPLVGQMGIEPFGIDIADEPSCPYADSRKSDDLKPRYSDIQEYQQTGKFLPHDTGKEHKFLRLIAKGYFIDVDVAKLNEKLKLSSSKFIKVFTDHI